MLTIQKINEEVSQTFDSVVPFKEVAGKQFLSLYDIKRLQLEEFVKKFEQCFDRNEAACEGLHGYFFYSERL